MIAVLATVCVFFFVLAGMMMYPSASDDAAVDSEGNIHGIRGTSQGNTVFTDLWARVANLVYLTFGAVNYPDIMLPSYIEDGGAALAYFIPAIVVFLFLFLNIVLAVVYNGYTSDRDERMVEENAKRCVALTLAFRAVAEGGTEISKDHFEKFVTAYREVENQFSLLPEAEVREEELEQLWMELQPQKRDGGAAIIGPYEFLQLPGLLAARRFREGPAWALREANCELVGVLRDDARHLGEDGTETEIKETDLATLKGKKVAVVRVRGYMGGEKILTRKLLKHRHVESEFHLRGNSSSSPGGDRSGSSDAPPSPFQANHKRGHLEKSRNRKEARKTCWVGGIPKDTSEEQISEAFSAYGTVIAVTVRGKEEDFGTWAFVKYGSGREVAVAISAGMTLAGATLSVKAVDVKSLDTSVVRKQGSAASVWNQHTEYKLDWSSGVPLVWRRPGDIHETAELIRFTGVVTDVDTKEQSLDIKCDFEEGSRDRDAISGDVIPRTACDRFLRGGLVRFCPLFL